MLRNLLSLSGE